MDNEMNGGFGWATRVHQGLRGSASGIVYIEEAILGKVLVEQDVQ
jgi:hypothetical protein